MTPKVAILIPAMRPQLIGALVENIQQVTPEPHHIYVMTNVEEVREALEPYDVTVWMDELQSWGRRLNAMYLRTDEPYMFLGADDIWFWEGWLRPALAQIQGANGVVTVNDQMNPSGTLALVSREYIDSESGCMDQPGVIIHPGYRHNYSETELFLTAKYRGRWSYCIQSIVEHRHFLIGAAEIDDVYQIGIDHYGDDKDRYLERCHMWGVDPSTIL